VTRLERAAGGLVMVAGLVATVGVLVVAATDDPGRTPAPCVPGYAVDYRGDLNAWLDAGGVIVLRAPEEDTYPWCTRP